MSRWWLDKDLEELGEKVQHPEVKALIELLIKMFEETPEREEQEE